MQITYRLTDFVYALFPEIDKGDVEALKLAIKRYYSDTATNPHISIEGDLIVITLQEQSESFKDHSFKKAIAYCELGEYASAKPLLESLIKENPTHSEYYRILGQIHSDEGDQDKAIDYLIDALRWNPENSHALLMMGNIFAKFKQDIDTALTYYDQTLLVKPDDYIALNNIGANLWRSGRTAKAKEYLNKALSLKPTYPNTHHGLGLLFEEDNSLQEAFQHFSDATFYAEQHTPIYRASVQKAMEISQRLTQGDQGISKIEGYLRKLEYRAEKEIRTQAHTDITTAAKIEFAENYNREYHLVKYNPNYPAFQHLVAHELVHLEYVLDARDKQSNKLFTSTAKHSEAFKNSLSAWIKTIRKKGFTQEQVDGFVAQLFQGLNSQIYNAPIDLFIEDKLFAEFKELRPYQFLSLYNLHQEAIQAVTDKRITDIAPRQIISASKIYNLIGAIHYNELYAIDVTAGFKATPKEQRDAQEFYNEYIEYRNEKEPSEEYELIQHWADDLNLNTFFELIDERSYRRNAESLEATLKRIQQDPFEATEDESVKEADVKAFLEAHGGSDLNMAVVMFMVEALGYFKDMPKEEIKKIAYEIAMQGAQGYDPKKQGYKVSAIKGKSFTGNQILAYYYVSWSLAIPEMLGELGLPFEGEYEMARKIDEQKFQ